jgi:RNA polymerase sigma factor (TIGR02999 family)
MAIPNSHELTRLLRAWSHGDKDALDKLTPLVYKELHRLAHHYMSRERDGHALQTTALIHEAYTRLLDCRDLKWQDRAHFFGVCARLMRQILTDFARSQMSQKRGATLERISLDEALDVPSKPRTDLVALDDALNRLAAIDARKSRVVELRFFGGLTAGETAELLKVSEDTVLRDWRLAKTWLHRELSGEMHSGG